MADLRKLRAGSSAAGRSPTGMPRLLSIWKGRAGGGLRSRAPAGRAACSALRRSGLVRRYGEMLAQERLDVVHITTPRRFTFPSPAVRRRRSACLPGKAARPDRSRAKELIDVVIAGGRQMTINYWPNFDPRRWSSSGCWLRAQSESRCTSRRSSATTSPELRQALMSDAAHWVHRLPGKLSRT